MVKQHPRPGPAHDNLDTFLHVPPIAMQRTVLTGRLVGPEPASIEPQTGILQHLAACRTQLRMSLLFPTIQPDHLLDDPLFPIDTTLHSTLFLFSNPPPASVRCRFAAGRSGGFSGAPSCGVPGKPLQRYLFTGKKPSAASLLRTIPPLWRSKYRDGAGCTPRAVREEPPHRRMPFRPDPGVIDRREAAA